MKKIIFSALTASMLMSFVVVEPETTRKVQTTQQIKSARNSFCYSYPINGFGYGVISVSTGISIPVNGAFSLVINVPSDLNSNQPVIATVPPGVSVSVSGVPMACGGSATSIEFYNTCYFTGGNCIDQP